MLFVLAWMACLRGWRASAGGVLAWVLYCKFYIVLYCKFCIVLYCIVLFFLFVCFFFSILYFTSIVIVYNSYTVQNNIIIKIDGHIVSWVARLRG